MDNLWIKQAVIHRYKRGRIGYPESIPKLSTSILQAYGRRIKGVKWGTTQAAPRPGSGRGAGLGGLCRPLQVKSKSRLMFEGIIEPSVKE